MYHGMFLNFSTLLGQWHIGAIFLQRLKNNNSFTTLVLADIGCLIWPQDIVQTLGKSSGSSRSTFVVQHNYCYKQYSEPMKIELQPIQSIFFKGKVKVHAFFLVQLHIFCALAATRTIKTENFRNKSFFSISFHDNNLARIHANFIFIPFFLPKENTRFFLKT